MTTSRTTRHEPSGQAAQPSTLARVRRGGRAGVVVAGCTAALAVIARAAHVSLEVNDPAIPIAAFASWSSGPLSESWWDGSFARAGSFFGDR